VSSRAEDLRRRREALLAQVNVDRELVGAQHARIAAGLTRADGWLTVARRVTPAAAIGAVILGLVVGPGRIVRMLQAAAVPAWMLRQFFSRSANAGGATLRDTVLRLLSRRRRAEEPAEDADDARSMR
jgi:hypothetical protein